MQCKVSVEKIKQALSVCESLSRKGVLLSVLEKTYIATSGNALIVYSTNLRSSVYMTIPAKVSAEGEVLCDGARILQALQYVKDDQATFELVGGVLKINTVQASVDMPVYPKDDFPVPLEIEKQAGVTFAIKDLVTLLDSVLFSAASGDAHPELGSVFVRTQNQKAIAAATDSFRLAEYSLNGVESAFDEGILIPQISVQMMIKVLGLFGESAECTVSVSDSTLYCATEGLLLRIQLSQGSFPDYERIIPAQKKTVCVLSTAELISSFKLCGAFSDSFHKVSINADPKTGTCIIMSQSSGMGSAKVTQPAQIEGEAFTCLVNAGYIVPFLQRAHTDAISITSDGEGRPLLITPHDKKSAYRYIVMPISG